MTTEQFRKLPETTRRIIGANYSNYQETGRILRALNVLCFADPFVLAHTGFNKTDLVNSYETFKKHIADTSKTIHCCASCLPLIRKSGPRKNTKKSPQVSCSFCGTKWNWRSANNPQFYSFRHHSTLAQTQAWFRETYPELQI